MSKSLKDILGKTTVMVSGCISEDWLSVKKVSPVELLSHDNGLGATELVKPFHL